MINRGISFILVNVRFTVTQNEPPVQVTTTVVTTRTATGFTSITPDVVPTATGTTNVSTGTGTGTATISIAGGTTSSEKQLNKK